MAINIEHIYKSFGDKCILNDIHFEIGNNELVALLGPSGCGKTTLLCIIAGLEQQSSGVILFDQQDMSALNTAQRHIGFMFQSYALFPHMTVFDNIAFGLKMKSGSRRKSNKEIYGLVQGLIERVQLNGLEKSYPAALSGGQKQRVALARAIATEPKVLLLDEPFAALDSQVRQSLRRWLRDLLSSLAITSIFVTHDQEEAFDIADRIVVMNQGVVEQIGTAEDIYLTPKTSFVQSFIGQSNEIDLSLWQGSAAFPASSSAFISKDSHSSFIRPHDIEVMAYPSDISLKAKLMVIKPLGSTIRLEFAHPSVKGPIIVEISRIRYEDYPLEPHHDYYLTPRNIRSFNEIDYVI